MPAARMAAATSRLEEYPAGLRRGSQHVEALAERHGQVAAGVRAAIATAQERGDQGTADLVTEISRGLDKHLWCLAAHLQTG